MARPVLPTDFKDDVLAESMAGKRRYRIIQNVDGTVSLDDVTDYEQVGSTFGAKQVNDMSSAVNSIEDVKAANNCTTTEPGFVLDARQGKNLMDKSNELGRDLGGLAFAQDTEGNWGYKIGGADPVIPFKTEPFVYDFSDGTFNLSDSSKPYYVKDYKKLTKQNFHGSCSWSCYEYFHHTDTADHEHRNSGGISFTYSPDTGTLIVKRNQTNGFITLVC